MTDDWLKRLTSDAERISAERQAARVDGRAEARAREQAQATRIRRNTAARKEAMAMVREAVTRTTRVLMAAKGPTDLQEAYRPEGRLGRLRAIKGWNVIFEWSQLQVKIPKLFRAEAALLRWHEKDHFSGRIYGIWLLPNGSLGSVGGAWNRWNSQTKIEFAQSVFPSRYAISENELSWGYSYEYRNVVENIDPDDYEPFTKDVARVIGLGFVEVLVRNKLSL
jgi:hypothetical protein